MIKKILPIILCLVLVFSISVSAENSTDVTNTENSVTTEEMPMQGERQVGGRGGMREKPQGENMPAGEMPPTMPNGQMPPAMPDGEIPTMPEGEMVPPQLEEGNVTESPKQAQTSNVESTDNVKDNATNENANNMPRGFGDMGDNMQENTQNTEATETEVTNGILGFVKSYSTPITAVILLMLAFVFVIFYKKKTY